MSHNTHIGTGITGRKFSFHGELRMGHFIMGGVAAPGIYHSIAL